SMRLDSASIDADANDIGTNWCASVEAFASGDLGTPGLDNGVCDFSCGDGECAADESCETCVADCGTCEGGCGDAACGIDETCLSCPEDCGACEGDCCDDLNGTPGCVDPVIAECVCALDSWCCTNEWDDICVEWAYTDCEACGGCDDGVCNVDETCSTCPEDCGACAECGDGVCEGDEDCDTCLADCSPCTTPTGVQPGDIIITEIMNNPAIADDSVGEWVELMNTTDAEIDLMGFTLSDNGADTHVIDLSLPIAAGGYVVLGASGDLGLNGLLTPDYVFDGIAFGNGSDSVMVWYDGVVIDEVAYDNGETFPDAKGVSMNLSLGITDATANDDGANWCGASVESIIAIAGEETDYGTPGAPNTVCAAESSCGDATCDADEDCATCEADCGPCDNCVPTDEICNGVDDDCDGDTDEGATLCDDGVGCTGDICEGAAGCTHPLAEDYCVIDGTCYPNEALNPGNDCESCQPFSSTSGWSNVNGGTCNDGDECTENDMCSGGSCAGQFIEVPDPYELNGSLSLAYDLMQDIPDKDEVKDTDSWPFGSLTAGIHSTETLDWFSYKTEDTAGFGDLESKVRLTQPSGSNYRVCVHFVCYEDVAMEDTEYECKDGSTLGTTITGEMACCDDGDDGDTVVKVRANCPGIAALSDDGGTTYVEVYRNGSADVCEPYTLEWGDD
ncbi:MAG: lamin tail domain-containing protein, partial [Myxococcota bacterium]